ncbi:MAG: TFIIB-type zinc ribbon-containing protein [Planctomycetota bacterium]
MNCPHCNTLLYPLMEKAIELHNCEQCDGQWLQGAELKRLATHRGVTRPEDAGSSPVPAPDLPRALMCPACSGQRLRATRWLPRPGSDPIVVDICGKCRGVWFDRDEFAHLLERRPPEGRLDKLSTWEWLIDSGWLVGLFLG